MPDKVWGAIVLFSFMTHNIQFIHVNSKYYPDIVIILNPFSCQLYVQPNHHSPLSPPPPHPNRKDIEMDGFPCYQDRNNKAPMLITINTIKPTGLILTC